MDNRTTVENRRYSVPACSISEDGGTVTVRLELPGVTKEGLEVRIEGNELSVSGERRRIEAAGTFLVRERRAEAYRKIFTIDDSIDRENVEANLSDGILSLVLRIREAAKPRRIEIA